MDEWREWRERSELTEQLILDDWARRQKSRGRALREGAVFWLIVCVAAGVMAWLALLLGKLF